MTEALNQRSFEDGLLISVEEIKQRYLFGIDLTDTDGNEMPKNYYEHNIRMAQAWLEKEIPGIMLCPKEIKSESHDYHLADYQSYCGIKLYRQPVIDVSEVAIQLPLSANRVVFDPSWYRTESVNGFINLLPTQGTFSSMLLSQGGSFLPLLYSGMPYVPHLFKITYTAGFKKGEVPANILEIIGLKAAMGPLNVFGDLVAGAGIASKSISLDGLSQSVATTSSATNSGYTARVVQYQKQLKDMLEDLAMQYTGIQMSVG